MLRCIIWRALVFVGVCQAQNSEVRVQSDQISCVRISQAFLPDFRWTTKSGCQLQVHQPPRKRALSMIFMCLSLVALGLVSLAGCQVQDHINVKATAETIQVPSLPELLSRPSAAVRGRFPHLEMSQQPLLDDLLPAKTSKRHLLSPTWTVAFGNCTFSGDYAGAPLVRTGSCPTQGGLLNLAGKGITSVPPDAFQNMTQMT